LRKPSIAIVDYGVGNLMSIRMGVERAGGLPTTTKSLEEALEADGLILPGVGAFKPAMNFLQPHRERLLQALREGKPLLGICLGMQLLFEESLEKGLTRGLGLLKGKVVELPGGVKKPHMGWNTVKIVKENPLLEGVKNNEYFYFVHSYVVEAEGEAVLATTTYGVEFPAVVGFNRTFGTQFHPEKSGPAGLRILKNFVWRVVVEG